MKIVPIDGKLSLTNDGNLEVFFIGTGSAFAKTHYQTNFLIIKGDKHVLIDFGTTGPMALEATTGLQVPDIEVFLPTHSHCDHIGGVEYLALMNRYVGIKFLNKPKLTMLINEPYEKVLWEMSLRGGMEWNEVNGEGKRLGFDDFFDVVRPTLIITEPREIWEVNYGDIHIELFRTNHIPEQAPSSEEAFITFGLYIDNRIFISGDTKFDQELIDMYAHRSEWMFHDTQINPNPVHACLPELKTLPEHITKKMFLVHYPDNAQTNPIDEFAGWTQQGMRYIFD
ncbi:MAG: MBL fold metallo-hydrolase [Bacteroidetes bacterium]|nr:MBL fold metallo-hydrolase [Bacteroidota bacterium]